MESKLGSTSKEDYNMFQEGESCELKEPNEVGLVTKEYLIGILKTLRVDIPCFDGSNFGNWIIR